MYIVRKYQIHFYALYKTDFCFVSFSGRFRSECKLISYYPTMTEEETVMTFSKPLFLNLKIKNKIKKINCKALYLKMGLSPACHTPVTFLAEISLWIIILVFLIFTKLWMVVGWWHCDFLYLRDVFHLEIKKEY